jgi:hypothetical protein
MKTSDIIKPMRKALTHLALALALAAGFTPGSAQAITTTNTYNFGPQNAGTTIQTGTTGFKQWIAKGALPPGSIVRSISAAIRLDSTVSDSWASDLLIYLDPQPATPATAALLQIGGNYSGAVGTVAQVVGWNEGDGGPGTTINQTFTAGVDWTGNIDLNAVELSIGNNYAEASWSGSITVEYDVTALTVVLNSPADNQAFDSGTSITPSATVFDPGPFSQTVKFHVTPISPSGPTVVTDSIDTVSPFTADLGALPTGTYQIYATVANDDAPPGTASSATRTFTVAEAITTTTILAPAGAPTTYGQNVTLTATVSPIPTGGTVQFYNGFNYLGSPVAVNTTTGVASISTTTLGAGTHEITAVYEGYQIYGTSTTAASISQVVGKAPLTVRALNTFRVPNTANPDSFPYQITGYQNGQNLAASGVTGTPELTTNAVLASPAGNYVITCAVGTLDASNYSFMLENGTLTVAEVADTFSVNFYFSPGFFTPEQTANLLVPAGVPAGMSDWFTSGWRNTEVPWGGGQQPLVTLTSNQGSTSTFSFKDCRNGWSSWGEPRPTNLGDGNYSMMGSGVNSTLHVDPPAVPGDNNFDMEMTDIPFAKYDVIFYFRANQPQYGDGTGVIVFNGGADRAFKLKPGAFDGNFIEMVDATTEGNCIIFRNVTGSSFTTQTWGTGDNGFNHIGPAGFQIREAAATTGFSAWADANGATDQSPDQDHDNDGVKNGIEYFMGQTGSSFTALHSLDETNTITWPMDPAYLGTYEVQTSPNLSDWTNVTPRPEPSGGNLSYLLPTGLGKRFVRLLVTPTP